MRSDTYCRACDTLCTGNLCDDCDHGSYDGDDFDAIADRLDAEQSRMTDAEIHAELVARYGSEAAVKRVIDNLKARIRWASENPEAACAALGDDDARR